MKTALWLRVSTDEQTTENQRIALEAEAARRGLEVVKVYDLSGVSGYRGQQERHISQAVKDARLGRFKVLLFWSLDRLSRQGIAKTLEICKKFSDVGCGLVSLQESEIDTTGPYGELLIAVWAHLAKMESERRSERTKAGLARAAQNGKHPGRPRGSKDSKQRKQRWDYDRFRVRG